jgi:hypothetical protein
MPENPYQPPKGVNENGGGLYWNPRWIGYTLLAAIVLWIAWILVEDYLIP